MCVLWKETNVKCPLCGTTQKKEKFVEEKKKELTHFNEKDKKNKEKVKILKRATSIQVSHHAIDRMSTRHLDIYLGYRDSDDQGIMSWMRQEGMSILESGQLKELQEQVIHLGCNWIFQKSKKSPTYTLMTVAPKNVKKLQGIKRW